MSPPKTGIWGRVKRLPLWKGERGFSLIEVLAASMIMGTVVVGTVSIIGATASTSSSARAGVELQDLVRAQVELIMQAPFKEDPAQYPALTNIPEAITLAFTSTDPGTKYIFPSPDGTVLTGVIQQIAVTATKGTDQTTMSFYKIRSP
jgi:prepilin-type N-terminal cleavage/methylation domain-containing protein